MDSKSSRPSQKRRAILQGSLAAPVVLTVSSASATTVTTLGKCMARQATENPPFFEGSSSDTWFRKSVTVTKLKYQGEEGWYYLDPNPYENTYVKLDPTTGTVQRMTFGSNLPNGWTEHGTSTREALVWIESDSGAEYDIMQVRRPLDFQAATLTCMNSFKSYKL